MGNGVYFGIMKRTALYISVNIFFVFLLVFCYQSISEFQYSTGNISEYNDVRMQVEEQLRIQENIERIQEEYHCDIFMVNQADYTDSLYHAMERGMLIFDYYREDQLAGKICFDMNGNLLEQLKQKLYHLILIVVLVFFIVFNLVSIYCYIKIIYPFKQLRKFAKNIARGDFDFPLKIQKDNYFGAFTESFDLMREELKIAREGEYQANLSKRELVASLSHDIKTPVATINALCEILELKLTEEESKKKVVIIHQKAEMIDKLISNMFHATLEELQALKIQASEQKSTMIPEIFEEMNHLQLIHFVNEISECLIYVDPLRLNQVIDNIVNNSYKYANTKIDVTFGETNHYITIHIRDYGLGVEESELAVITQKFYRGSNSKGQNGSGLGLYLAKQFMEGMGGSLECESNQGFLVTITIKKV